MYKRAHTIHREAMKPCAGSLIFLLFLLPTRAFENASHFENTMTVTASVPASSSPSSGYLIATVGGLLRGVASPMLVPFGPQKGTFVYGLTVHGNDGETVSFSKRGEGGASLFRTTLSFRADDSVGNAVSPLEVV